jgi:hypothetical protein
MSAHADAAPLPCVVCKVAPRDTLPRGCGHLYMCYDCAVAGRQCPVCKVAYRAKGLIRVYG